MVRIDVRAALANALAFVGSFGYPANVRAEAILLFGPSRNEGMFLFTFPLLFSVVAALVMLGSWRTFVALLLACVAALAWCFVGFSLLTTIVGAYMLYFGAWALFVFICIACYLALREQASPTQMPRAPAPAAPPSTYLPIGPPGQCPNCNATIPLDSRECSKCGALFTEGSAWRVGPV